MGQGRPPDVSARGMWAELLAAHLADGTALDLLWDRPAAGRPAEREMWAWDRSHDLDAALVQDTLRVGGSCSGPRTLHLRGVRIWSRVDLDGLSGSIALMLEDCLLEEGLSVHGAHLSGLVLRRCRIGRADLTRPALDAAGLRLDDALSIPGSLFVAGGPGAALDVTDGWIGGLDADGAEITATGGAALVGRRLHTRGGVHLDGGFVARGNAPGATVDLTAARIGGELAMDGAQLHNPSGPAMIADALHTGHDLHADGLTATGAGGGGVIGLAGAHIGGAVRIDGARWENRTGPALAAGRLHTEGDLTLTRLTATGAGPDPTVDLEGARVGGRLDCATPWVSNASHPRHQWHLDGLAYAGIPRLNTHGRRLNREAWLALLQSATPAYAAQPYRQLAAAYRGEGGDRDARAVMIAQRRDHCARGSLAPAERAWARLTGVLVGFGYQPWRALLGLAGVLAISIVVTAILGMQGALAAVPAPEAAGASCRPLELLGAALDLGIPLLTTGSGCAPTSSGIGTVLTISRWVLQLAAWALLATFLTAVVLEQSRRRPAP
jgi:hypothetical protein